MGLTLSGLSGGSWFELDLTSCCSMIHELLLEAPFSVSGRVLQQANCFTIIWGGQNINCLRSRELFDVFMERRRFSASLWASSVIKHFCNHSLGPISLNGRSFLRLVLSFFCQVCFWSLLYFFSYRVIIIYKQRQKEYSGKGCEIQLYLKGYTEILEKRLQIWPSRR